MPSFMCAVGDAGVEPPTSIAVGFTALRYMLLQATQFSLPFATLCLVWTPHLYRQRLSLVKVILHCREILFSAHGTRLSLETLIGFLREVVSAALRLVWLEEHSERDGTEELFWRLLYKVVFALLILSSHERANNPHTFFYNGLCGSMVCNEHFGQDSTIMMILEGVRKRQRPMCLGARPGGCRESLCAW